MKNAILIFILIPAFLIGQGWEKTYESGSGNSTQQTVEGGYIVAGDSYYGYPDDIFLMNTDANGEIIWFKTYSGNNHNLGNAVQQTTDGGYIIAGSCFSDIYYPDIFLVKTNGSGDVIWTKTYGSENAETGRSVEQTTDGGYIITGHFASGIWESDVYLVKVDENGEILWTQTYFSSTADQGSSVQQTTDGGYIIAGTKNFHPGPSEIYLIKTDEIGDISWTKSYGGNFNNKGYSAQQTIDGGYIIAGEYGTDVDYSDIYLVKTDMFGDTLWTKSFSQSYSNVGSSVKQTTDGGFFLTGYTYSDSDPGDVYMVKTNNNGDTIWTKTYGGINFDTGNSGEQTTDGGFIVTGASAGFIYLLKTDENGIITSTTEIPVPNPNRKLAKIVDLSGREIVNPEYNHPYIEIYDDGTTQKKMNIKQSTAHNK